jgi:hypothetical protein
MLLLDYIKNPWLIFVFIGLTLILSVFFIYVKSFCDTDRNTDFINTVDVKNANYNACIAKSKQNMKLVNYFIIIGSILLGIGLIMYKKSLK